MYREDVNSCQCGSRDWTNQTERSSPKYSEEPFELAFVYVIPQISPPIIFIATWIYHSFLYPTMIHEMLHNYGSYYILLHLIRHPIRLWTPWKHLVYLSISNLVKSRKGVLHKWGDGWICVTPCKFQKYFHLHYLISSSRDLVSYCDY